MAQQSPALTIKRNDPGPAAPPVEEPIPWKLPHMAQAAAVIAPKVWRPQLSEMDDLLSWLLPTLRKAWPDMSDDHTVADIRAAMTDPRSLLVRTSMVAGLFVAARDRRDGLKVAEDFVRSRAPNNDEATLLYRFAEDWAASIGARRFLFNLDSDAAMLHVQPAMNNLQKGYKVKKESLYSVEMTQRGP